MVWAKSFLKKLPHPVFHTFFRFYNLSAETFFRESPLTLYSTLFSRLDEKIIKLFFGRTVGTLSTLLIELKNLSRNLFSDKQKAEKENRIGWFPSAHSGNDSRRNGETGVLFVVLFLFLYIFFLLYSSHWGFMVNPPMVHLIQTLPPWLQRYWFFWCVHLTHGKRPQTGEKSACFAESFVWLTHRFRDDTCAWHTAFFQPICAKKRANAVKTRGNAVGSAVRCESGRAFDALPFSRLKIDPWKYSWNPFYKELLNNSPPNLPNIQSCIKWWIKH